MKKTNYSLWIAVKCLLLSGLAFSGCTSVESVESVEFTVTFDAGDFVLQQGKHEEQRVHIVDDYTEVSDDYVELVQGEEGLELVKKTISDAPDSIPWQAWASQGILCAPQNSFSFHGRYTKDSIFFPLGNTDSVYGLVYGAAGEQVHFYRGGGVVYTIEAPQPGASAREGSDPAPRPNPTPSSLESGDSVLYLVTCYFSSMVLDGGQSIIYIIDNIGDPIDPIYRRDHSDRSSKMEEYCAFGARAGAEEAHAPLGTAAREEYTCNPTGASDFDASTPIMIPAENWCSRLAVFHHCLTVTMPDSTTHVINNVTCQVEITLMGDSVAIRSGCPTNSANCCAQDDPDR